MYFEVSSLLNIDKENLWIDVWDFDNVNKELAPLVTINPPDLDFTNVTIDNIPLNQKLFDSYVFLLKVIPIDIHHFAFSNIIEFERFDETSTSLLLKKWTHSRILEDKGHQTLLIDQVRFEHRISLLGKVLFPIYKGIFQHRHNYLRKKYNESRIIKNNST